VKYWMIIYEFRRMFMNTKTLWMIALIFIGLAFLWRDDSQENFATCYCPTEIPGHLVPVNTTSKPPQTASSILRPGMKVALWNPTNRRFMRVSNSGNVDNGGVHDPTLPPEWTWERFVVYDAGNGLIALYNPTNKKFVRVNSDGNVDTGPVTDPPLPPKWTWEKLQVLDLGNNEVALYNQTNKKFIRMNKTGNVDTGPVAHPPLPKEWTWERWRVIKY